MPDEAGAVSLHQRSLGLQVGIVSAPRVEAGALIEAYMTTSLGSQLWPTVHTACCHKIGSLDMLLDKDPCDVGSG